MKMMFWRLLNDAGRRGAGSVAKEVNAPERRNGAKLKNEFLSLLI